MPTIKELKEKRAKLTKEAREIQDLAETGERKMSAEEATRQDTIFAEVETLTDTIERQEKLAQMELQARARDDKETEKRNDAPPADAERTKRHAEVFRAFLLRGERGMSADEARDLVTFTRAMAAFSGDQGGALLAPMEFSNQLIQAIGNRIAIKERATVQNINTLAGLGVVTVDNDLTDPDWTAELGAPTEDPGLNFGKRELRPHQLTKEVKLPITLVQSTTIGIDALVNARMARKFAYAEDNNYINGDGAGKPLGFMVAAADGVPTSRDVVAGTTTELTWDGLIDSQEKLRSEYWANAVWIFCRSAIQQLRKLKDGEGRYLWEPSVKVGEPDVILGRPYIIDDYMPSVFTTGKYVGMFADLSYYWIAQFNLVYMQRLDELYARTNQVGYIGRRWIDGMPILAEAFARLKLA